MIKTTNQKILERVYAVVTECQRFLRLEPAVRAHFDNDSYASFRSAPFARLKRQSLELSRALVELRKGAGE